MKIDNNGKEIMSLALLITWPRLLPRGQTGQPCPHLLGPHPQLRGPLRVLLLSERRANLRARRPQLCPQYINDMSVFLVLSVDYDCIVKVCNPVVCASCDF